MRNPFIQQAILFTVFQTILALNLNAQGKTTLVEGHHLAGVNLTLGYTSSIPLNYFVKLQGAGISNAIPGYNTQYADGNTSMNGIMSDAALAIDWWTLFGEPAEQYLFTWKAKDYYEINSLDATGTNTINRTVNKNDLKKYPDLLLRYENIKPTEIEFEIQWGLEDKDVFDKTGMFFVSYYGVKNSFKTKVSSASILIEPSGKTPFGVPGIRQGKGEAFLGLEKNFPKDKLQGLMQLFNKAPYQYINAVIVTKIKWPLGEMKAIADKYDQYERGEATPSPTQIINEELRKQQNLTAYNNNDFWGDAYEELNTNLNEFYEDGKVGFKNEKGKIVIPPIFKWATYISKHKTIVAQEFDKEPGIYTTKGVLRLNLKDYRDSKILEETDYILISTYTTGYYVNLKSAQIVFNIPLHGGNYINSKRKYIPVNKYNYQNFQSNVNPDDVSPSLTEMTSQGILPSTVYYVMGDFIMKNSGGWTIRKVHFYGVTKSQEIKLFFTGKLRFGF